MTRQKQSVILSATKKSGCHSRGSGNLKQAKGMDTLFQGYDKKINSVIPAEAGFNHHRAKRGNP